MLSILILPTNRILDLHIVAVFILPNVYDLYDSDSEISVSEMIYSTVLISLNAVNSTDVNIIVQHICLST